MTLHSLVLAFGIVTHAAQSIEPMTPTDLVHVNNTFHFEVAAAMSRVAPLFGPEAERKWAGEHWSPEFIYPRPAKDIQGAVFRIVHGSHTSIWVNTLFDLPDGRMQYVSFNDGMFVTTVDVKLTSLDKSHTAVEVTYVRTALQPAANDDVLSLGNRDRDSGPDWKRSIEECLNIKAE
jgi:hypothetical protein